LRRCSPLVVVLAGCRADPATHTAESLNKSPNPKATGVVVPIDPAQTGSVSGTVSFVGTAPAKVVIDTTMDPACGLGGGTVYAEQVVVNAGKLANVFVYVKSGPPAAMSAGGAFVVPVVLDQKGCRYVPHVVGVVQGGAVSFHNSDPTMHNIHATGGESLNISQGPKGAPVERKFLKPELMVPVRCNNHPWMSAFIHVSATPFFAVTDGAGAFSLAGLPAGEYVLGALQEKLGEKEMRVTVKAKGAATADVNFGGQSR
jgi:plastocyanin